MNNVDFEKSIDSDKNVAVSNVSWTSATEMLLWQRFREHRLEKCCRGEGFVDIEFEHVAVALVSCVSICKILLWLTFCSNAIECPFCWPTKHESERPREIE